MRLALIMTLGLFAMGATAYAAGQDGKPTCNWGDLTSSSISDGFEQGPHSADPSGDGHGPGTADEPRAGLPNVIVKGNLEATCEFITDALPD